jgi:hypothetical protein
MSEEKKKLTLLVSCSGFCYQQHEVDAYIQELKVSERTARNLASMAYGLEQQYKADLIKEKNTSLHLKIALYDLRYKAAEARLYDLEKTLLRMRDIPDPRVAKLLIDEYERKVAMWKKIKLVLWNYRVKIDPNFKERIIKPLKDNEVKTFEDVVAREG